MFKKYTALFFICISGIIYAGHSFIPHQHHHEHLENSDTIFVNDHHDNHHHDEHHDEKNKQNNPDEHSDFSDILAHFTLGESFFKVDDDHKLKINFNKGESASALVSYIVKWVEFIPVPISEIFYHYKEPEYNSLVCIPFGKRAPPFVV